MREILGMNEPGNCLKGQLGDYEILLTDDQSPTLLSHYFQEACHSLSGAREETLHNYLRPCQVLDKARKSSQLVILEVGLGLGVGVKTTFEALGELAFDQMAHIHYIALELDPKLVEFAEKLSPINTDHFPRWSDLIPRSYGLEAQKNNHKLSILLGDARSTLPAFAKTSTHFVLDIIYQDPFSPKKNPELWSLEWFQLLHSLGHSKTCLSTYSASQSVRKAMMQANLKVQSFSGLGRKRECTLALWEGDSDPKMTPILENPKVEIVRDLNFPLLR